MPVEVRGVAHPPPTHGGRDDPSDLNAAEIATTQLGGAPLFWEHQTSSRPVGQVLASWEGSDGSLRMSAIVTDPTTEKRVRNGTARGLSLGTDVISTDKGDVLMRAQRELSVCKEGRRPGTFIDHVGGQRVLRRAKASRGEDVSKESYEELKRQLAQKSQDLADARARSDVFEQKERTRISAFQPDAKAFIDELMTGADAETKADLAPMQQWAGDFHTKSDVLAQAPLARLVACASARVKRSREEASTNTEASATLGKTMKELEAVTTERDALKQRVGELGALADERQAGLERLQSELSKAGLVAEKFDFSKASSREANPAETPEPVAAKEEIKQVTSNASRPTDHLLSEIFNRGGGSLRFVSSSTTHQLLGSSNGGSTDIAAAIRAGF